MALWTLHAPGRYAFVPVDGPVVMFEFGTSRHLSTGIDTINEVRTPVSAFYFMDGLHDLHRSTHPTSPPAISLSLTASGPQSWEDCGMALLRAPSPIALTRSNTGSERRIPKSQVAQGTEGGGHTGHVGTMALLPQVLDAVDVPVVAAGGFGDGRGLAAALVMGCQGVWVGTRFLASA